MAGCCVGGNETSGFIKDREFRDQVSDYQLLKKFVEPAECRGAARGHA